MGIRITDISTVHSSLVVELLTQFGREFYPHLDGSSKDIEDVVGKIKDSGIGYMAIKESRAVGGIAGIIHGNMFNKHRIMLSEIFWYVRKDHRQTPLGGRLLLKYLAKAKEQRLNVTMVTLPTTSASVDDKLKKYGFARREQTWVRWEDE